MAKRINRILAIVSVLTVIILLVVFYLDSIKRSTKISDSLAELRCMVDAANKNCSEQMELIRKCEEDNIDSIVTKLDEINVTIEKLQGESVTTKRKVESIAAELARKSGDRTGNDEAYLSFVRDGNKYFEKKNYSASAKSFSDALLLYGGDDVVRMKRVLSLYYQNPLDKKNYQSILDEIELLKKNGVKDSRLEDVEASIKKEMGNKK